MSTDVRTAHGTSKPRVDGAFLDSSSSSSFFCACLKTPPVASATQKTNSSARLAPLVSPQLPIHPDNHPPLPSQQRLALRRCTSVNLATAQNQQPDRSSPPVHSQREASNSDNKYMRARSASVRLSQARGDDGDKQPVGGASKLDMLAAKGCSWKAVRARLPPTRQVVHTVRRPRVLLGVALLTAVVLLWRSMGSAAGEMQRFHCWGPSKPPMRMTANEREEWHAHLNTPVVFNHHKPIEINATEIAHVDLNQVKSTVDAVRNKERVLILTPLRDASYHLPKHFDLITQLTYPHNLIDLAFLVGDTTDDTMAALAKELERVQNNPEIAFRSALIVEKDFGVDRSQSVEDRHAFEAQGPRRKAMGKARNYLLSTALKPEHSWVYWRDVDIVDSPAMIIEDMVAHDKDVIVPSGFGSHGQDGTRLLICHRHLVPQVPRGEGQDG